MKKNIFSKVSFFIFFYFDPWDFHLCGQVTQVKQQIHNFTGSKVYFIPSPTLLSSLHGINWCSLLLFLFFSLSLCYDFSQALLSHEKTRRGNEKVTSDQCVIIRNYWLTPIATCVTSITSELKRGDRMARIEKVKAKFALVNSCLNLFFSVRCKHELMSAPCVIVGRVVCHIFTRLLLMNKRTWSLTV